MSVVHRFHGDALAASRAADDDKRGKVAISARVQPIDMIATLREPLPASPNEVIVYVEPSEARKFAAEILAAADVVDPDGVFCLHCASADHAQEEHDRIAALTGAEHAAALAEFNAKRGR